MEQEPSRFFADRNPATTAYKRKFERVASWLIVIAILIGFVYFWAFPSPERRALCELRAVCEKYGATRLECATAGNFNTCLTVKMGKNYSNVWACDDEGKLISPPKKMPFAIMCHYPF
jgi:hypothetical protein